MLPSCIYRLCNPIKFLVRCGRKSPGNLRCESVPDSQVRNRTVKLLARYSVNNLDTSARRASPLWKVNRRAFYPDNRIIRIVRKKKKKIPPNGFIARWGWLWRLPGVESRFCARVRNGRASDGAALLPRFFDVPAECAKYTCIRISRAVPARLWWVRGRTRAWRRAVRPLCDDFCVQYESPLRWSATLRRNQKPFCSCRKEHWY